MPGKAASAPKAKIPKAVYWDTNVFISLFDGGRHRTEEQKEGIRYWRDLADSGATNIVTSTLTFVELLEGRLTPTQARQVDLFLRARVDVKDATLGVMMKAQGLRQYYVDQKRQKLAELQRLGREGQKVSCLCTPDAIHLATAIIFDCELFHTFDRRSKRGCLGLLPLSLPTTTMRVCQPTAPPKLAQSTFMAALEDNDTDQMSLIPPPPVSEERDPS